MTRLREHRLRLDGRDVTLLDGPAGWGECSPLPGYPGDPAAAWRAAEEAARDGWPAPRRADVPVNALVTGPPVDPAALAGYPAVKVKVGKPGDVDLVAAVRDAIGPHVALRVDANGAWDLDTARDRIGRLARYDLEYVEQPVPTLDDLARLRRLVDVPLAADECVRTADDARRLHALDAADLLVLKVQPAGGVRAALTLAELAGVPAVASSQHETSVGVAAGLALAAALPELRFACGLVPGVGPRHPDVTAQPLVATDGRLAVRAVTPDPALLARYAAEPRPVDPGRQLVSERVGPFQVQRVASPVHDPHLGVVADRGRHLPGRGRVGAVVAARHQQHRHVELAEPVPQRLLAALPQLPELVRDPVHRVPTPSVVEHRRLAGQRLEEPLVQPPLQERVDAVPLQLLGLALVGGDPRLRRAGAADPCRAAHQDQPVHEAGVVERQAQRQPGPHRVAAPYRLPAPVAERVGGADEVETVGDLDGLHVPLHRQRPLHAPPRLGGVREPRDQPQTHRSILT